MKGSGTELRFQPGHRTLEHRAESISKRVWLDVRDPSECRLAIASIKLNRPGLSGDSII